jgi:hypothetical protein
MGTQVVVGWTYGTADSHNGALTPVMATQPEGVILFWHPPGLFSPIGSQNSPQQTLRPASDGARPAQLAGSIALLGEQRRSRRNKPVLRAKTPLKMPDLAVIMALLEP